MGKRKVSGWLSLSLLSDIVFALPGPCDAVAQRINQPVTRVRKALRQLHAVRLIRKAGAEPRGVRNAPATLWAQGSEPDDVALTKAGKPFPGRANRSLRMSAQAIAFASVMRALNEGAHTTHGLAEVTGISVSAVRRFLRHMHAAKRIHVSSWERSGQIWVAEFSLGSERDASRPAPLTREEINARWRSANAHRNMQRAIEFAIVRSAPVLAADDTTSPEDHTMTPQPTRNLAFLPLDAHILRRAAQPDGYATVDWPGLKIAQVRSRVERFVAMGKLHPGRAGYRTVRYFTDPERAAEWARQHQTAESKRKEALKAGLMPAWRGATLSKDAPVQIPATVKVQVIPHRPGRYEVTGPIERAITNDWLAERMGSRSAA